MSKTTFIIEPGKQEMIMKRTFNAPRELVFKAFTDPELIGRWWGPRRLTTRIDKMEVRAGGQWRFVQQDSEGHEFGFHGVYHEVNGPERAVQTFEFEGVPGHVVLETMTLEEQDGQTFLTTLSVFQTLEDRDGMVSSGMESGASEGMERLDELLEILKEQAAAPASR